MFELTVGGHVQDLNLTLHQHFTSAKYIDGGYIIIDSYIMVGCLKKHKDIKKLKKYI